MLTERIAKVRITYFNENLLEASTSDLELVETPITTIFTVPACNAKDAVLFAKLQLVNYPNIKHPEVEFIGWQSDDDVEAIEKRAIRGALIFASILVGIVLAGFVLQYVS